jgi:stage II sporulation protein D
MARRARATVASLLAVAAIGAVPASAEAEVGWVVHGGGFGHGVGLSAYGAYGYGLHGYGYRQILHHYFRHIQITTLKRAPMVRVLLSISPGDVGFTHATDACGQRLEPSRSYLAHRNGSSVRLLSSSGKLLARCGGLLHADSRGVLRIAGLGLYRGALEVVPTESRGGSLNVINDLNVNNYARGSVPAEVPPEWPMATLKTFALASRSIALSTDVGGNGFALYSDTRTQNYGGVGVESPRTDAAIRATRNQVVTYRGEVAQTTYFSASGGRTESHFLGAPPAPYDESVPDPYDYYSPLHRWTFRFSEAEIDAKLGGYLDGRLRRVVVTSRGQSGRINYAKLVGTGGTTTIRGDSLELALGLYDRLAYFKKLTR